MSEADSVGIRRHLDDMLQKLVSTKTIRRHGESESAPEGEPPAH